MRSSLRKTRHAAKCAVAVFLVSVAARAQSASEVRKGRLLPVNAREATRGAISPDGRWFAYSVVLAHDRQIWLLDQATGTILENNNVSIDEVKNGRVSKTPSPIPDVTPTPTPNGRAATAPGVTPPIAVR